MEERGQSNSTGQHKLILQNRKSGSFTGVTDVVNFDANEIILDTELGRLTIKGKELHVNRLDLQKKEVEIDGTVDMLQYSGTPGRGCLWKVVRLSGRGQDFCTFFSVWDDSICGI